MDTIINVNTNSNCIPWAQEAFVHRVDRNWIGGHVQFNAL